MTALKIYSRFCRPVTGVWTTGEKRAKFGYDFWYQPHWDVMLSSEWGAPKSFKMGFSLPDTQDEGTAKDVLLDLHTFINVGRDSSVGIVTVWAAIAQLV